MFSGVFQPKFCQISNDIAQMAILETIKKRALQEIEHAQKQISRLKQTFQICNCPRVTRVRKA